MNTAVLKIAPSKEQKHVLLHVGLFALVVSGLSWNYDAMLFVRLRLIADDAFQFGNPDRPLLLLDGSEELLTYQPKRVAEFLSFPSMKIRSAASLTLAERQSDRDPHTWIGVAPKLIRAYAVESEPVARKCARSALENLPLVSPEDAATVVAFVQDMEPSDESTRALYSALLEKAVQARPELRPDVIDWSLELLDSSDTDERRAGMHHLATLAPDAAPTLDAIRSAVQAGDPDALAKPVARKILHRNPRLIDDLLNGSSAERAFLRETAKEDLQPSIHYCTRSTARLFSDAQLQRIKAMAGTEKR